MQQEKFSDQTGKLAIKVYRVYKSFGGKKAHFAGMAEINMQVIDMRKPK